MERAAYDDELAEYEREAAGRREWVTPNRAMRREFVRLNKRRVPTSEHLVARMRGPETSRAARDFARVWLRFPDTTASNIAARVNGLMRRRARNKVARASRKRNRP